MGLRINYNGAAANAWRNLGINDANLSGSVSKLSSGLRINKGADDPAGLIISERLKAQITGLGQAVQNAEEATSLVQTAEGALTEMNNMLNKMRGLAVHASNSGVQDDDSIAADQKQIDSALDSLQKIAINTKFQAKTLLDGSAGTQSLAESADMASVVLKGAADNINEGHAFEVDITTQAQTAVLTGTGFSTNHGAGSLKITSNKTAGEVTVNFAAGATETQIMNAVNNVTDQTGITASLDTDQLVFTGDTYGTDGTFSVTSDTATVVAAAAATVSDAGVDIAGQILYQDENAVDQTLNTTGSGLTLTVNSGEAQLQGSRITIDSGSNAVATLANAFEVNDASLTFSLGQDAAADEMRTVSIANMQITELGEGSEAGGGSNLNSIRGGGAFDLATDAQNAIKIIDQAINDVSIARAELGAFQQNALETTIKTLNINKENLEASNSRITDVDMAQEMMKFTRSQILTQAGTAMLAQANQLPQSVLQLLG